MNFSIAALLVFSTVFSTELLLAQENLQQFIQNNPSTALEQSRSNLLLLESVDPVSLLRQQYQKVLADTQALTGSNAGYSPYYSRDLMARHFINRPDWESFLAKGGVDPSEVYDPKPITWVNWQKTMLEEVLSAARNQAPLTKEMLLQWNQTALNNTLPDYVKIGALKESPNYGENILTRDALSKDEVAATLQVKFPGESTPALGWTNLRCYEEISSQKLSLPGDLSSCQQIFETAKKKKGGGFFHKKDPFWQKTFDDMQAGLLYKKWYWYACWPQLSDDEAAKQERNCGMIAYPAVSKVEVILNSILANVNNYFSTATSASAENILSVSPIEFAAKTQRQLVALHPFNKGNGRVSRWIMDYITERSSLPPILIKNMNLDLSTDESTYTQQAYLGAKESLSIMEVCLKSAKTLSADQLSKTICADIRK